MKGVPLQGVFARRRAGILLHPTSLPESPGNGDLGPQAYRFVDFLASCGMSVWQMLPLGPTHEDHSPYQCWSVHAGDYRLISLQVLIKLGWLDQLPKIKEGEADAQRRICLEAAYCGFQRAVNDEQRQAFEQFLEKHHYWLDDFSLYQALHFEHMGRAWLDWAPELRDREPAAMATARKRLAGPIAQARFEQYVFFTQWHELRDYANKRGVLLFGDVPIFVAHDSAEVWAHPEFFNLDEHGQLITVAGVPPDYFSETGQRWGNPHYLWDRLEADEFRWWIERMHTQMELFDLIRIDHFRGFEAFWEIPAKEETAINGRWVKVPGEKFFNKLKSEFNPLPFVAEDLGIITSEVDELRCRFDLPGMKVLQFAFGGGANNPYLPHNHEVMSVVYTGTHDNNTSLGWYKELTDAERALLRNYLGHPQDDMPWPLIRAALASVAQLAIVPLQDVLELDGEYRLNTPGVTEGNWRWRFDWQQVPDELVDSLRYLLGLYGRSGY